MQTKNDISKPEDPPKQEAGEGCSGATCSASSFETVEMIRQEWMNPGFYSEDDKGRPYPGYVAIKTNIGWLLLGCVERVQTSTYGGYCRRLFRDGEIHEQNDLRQPPLPADDNNNNTKSAVR